MYCTVVVISRFFMFDPERDSLTFWIPNNSKRAIFKKLNRFTDTMNMYSKYTATGTSSI